jgi:four helix bundle protein
MHHNFQELKIWQKSIELTMQIYNLLSKFPIEEKYGLKSQMRRAVVSIPSNIAEGAGRNSKKEFLYFLSIANGSSYELQTQLVIAEKLGLAATDRVEQVTYAIEELQKMMYGFRKTLQTTKSKI